MPCLTFVTILASFVLILLTPHPVSAVSTINSATLNGASSVTVAPSTSITASVTWTGASADNWRSTSWNVSGAICVDHANHTSAGTYTENFSVTAPATPGTYDISFIAYANNTCSGGSSNTYTLTGGIIVSSATPTPTPGPGTPTATPAPSSGGTAGTVYYPSISLTPYHPNPTRNSTLAYGGSASIEQGTIYAVEFTITNGAEWLPATPTDGAFDEGNESFSFTTPLFPQGTHTILVRAVSTTRIVTQKNNYATDTVTIITTPPTITLNPIVPNPTKNTQPVITGQAHASLGNIARADVSLDGGTTWFPTVLRNGAFRMTTETLEDGNYDVRARAVDAAGNIGYSQPQTLIIDTIPPVIGGALQSIGPHPLSPNNTGTITVVAGVETTLAVGMKGGVIKAVATAGNTPFPMRHLPGTSVWTSTINVHARGSYPLTITATDGAGNTTVRTLHTLDVSPRAIVTEKLSRTPIEHAKVTTYVWEPTTSQWILWDGVSYGQQNPTSTDAAGAYSIMVPPGTFYIEVSASGFRSAQSAILKTSHTSTISVPIALTSVPHITVTLPIIGRIVLAFPSLWPPETFTIPLEDAVDAGDLPLTSQGPVPAYPPVKQRIGVPLVVTFLSSWSTQAQEQASNLAQLPTHPRYRTLAIFLQDSESTTKSLVTKGGYTFPAVTDKDGLTAADFGVTILPYHLFVDSDGNIQGRYAGVLTADQLQQILLRMQ